MEDTKPKTAILYYLKDHADTALAKAVSLYRSGKIRENEMGANDYYAWGDALQGLRQYDQAINEFTKSLNVNPQLCEALNNIGNTYILKYQSAGRPEHLNAAESFYSKAIKCNPTDAAAHCGLGNVFMRKWRASGYKDAHSRQAAIDQSEEALKFDPTSPEAAVNMGYIQFMDGHRDDALTYFRALGEKFPDKAVVFVNFGYLLWKTYIENGKTPALQDAIDQTKRAWEFDQKSYIAANNLASFYYEIGSSVQASEVWEKAYELNPKDPDIIAGSALGLFSVGKKDQAIERYRQAVRREPGVNDPEFLGKQYGWPAKAVRDIAALRAVATATE